MQVKRKFTAHGHGLYCGWKNRYEYWGDAATVLATQEQNIEKLDVDANGKWILVHDEASDPSYGFKAGRNELLPYPQEELDQNPNIVQNPGY